MESDNCFWSFWLCVPGPNNHIFYYVYGLLHSEEYRTRFANALKKKLPRISMCKQLRVFSKAGRDLAKLHLNYETVEPYPLVEVGADTSVRTIEDKMRFKARNIKDFILVNSKLTLTDIPAEAYEYVVNGKSALEWVMERYTITTDKVSGIVNDPNDWCTEHNDPDYIVNLVKRVVTVSVESGKIIKSLPPLDIIA